MYSEKQTKPNNLFVPFFYQFSALLSPFVKLFELCIATSPFYSPSLRLSLSQPKYLFHAVREWIQFTVYDEVISFQESRVDNWTC